MMLWGTAYIGNPPDAVFFAVTLLILGIGPLYAFLFIAVYPLFESFKFLPHEYCTGVVISVGEEYQPGGEPIYGENDAGYTVMYGYTGPSSNWHWDVLVEFPQTGKRMILHTINDSIYQENPYPLQSKVIFRRLRLGVFDWLFYGWTVDQPHHGMPPVTSSSQPPIVAPSQTISTIEFAKRFRWIPAVMLLFTLLYLVFGALNAGYNAISAYGDNGLTWNWIAVGFSSEYDRTSLCLLLLVYMVFYFQDFLAYL